MLDTLPTDISIEELTTFVARPPAICFSTYASMNYLLKNKTLIFNIDVHEIATKQANLNFNYNEYGL